MRAFLLESADATPVSVETLRDEMGVLYWKLDMSEREAVSPSYQEQLERICKERDYKNRDEVCVRESE